MKKCQSIRFLIILVLSLFPYLLYGQGFNVKEFKTLQFDISGSTNMREDSVGIPCGLVKVLSDNPQIEFGGDVIGSVDNKINEYWVYLPKGTKGFIIKRDQYLPLLVKFSDYGIEGIEPKVTYQLKLKDASFNPDKNSLVVNVKPPMASLYVDGIIIDKNESGSYRLLLEKGEHVCRLAARGYKSKMEIVKIGKSPQMLNIDLESLLAKVNIECETTDADIYVNSNKIGIGVWIGNLPAGDYTIEAKKLGHISQIITVSLSEKENRTITIPKLAREKILFHIMSTPSECFMRKVKIDGKTIGSDSVCTTLITAGRHVVEVDITGCFPIREMIEISKTDTLLFNLTPKTTEYKKAYLNDISACVKMVRNSYQGESLFWGDRACKLLYKLSSTSIKQIWDHNKLEWAFLVDLYKRNEETAKAYRLLEQLEYCAVDALFLADCYYGMSDYKKAILWYEKSAKDAYRAQPQVSDCYLKIGMCYKEIGDYEKAIEYGIKAERKYSGDVPPKEFLAECYLHKGNREMSIRWFRTALRCYISGNYFGREQFLKRMKELSLYDAVISGIL